MKTLLLTLISVLALNSYAQNVNIPDANFKAYLVGNTLINTNGDAEIQVSEATAFSGEIDCAGQSISDLTGIEAFTALTQLTCNNNELTSLNVSQNTALYGLSCHYNQLTSLDVSQNTALTYLGCWNNLLLTSLDVSGATALSQLVCYWSSLNSLDVTQNTALSGLSCGNNQLTSLDVSQNTDLFELDCRNNQLQCLNVKNVINANFESFYAINNPNLTCIEVDDVAWSNANWINIDAQTSFSTNCNNACTSTIGITDLSNTPKQLLKIVDLMGRETPYKPNTVLIYVFDDGTTEKVFKMEE